MSLKISKIKKNILKNILLIFTVLSFAYSFLILMFIFNNISNLVDCNFSLQELETLEKQGITEDFEKHKISYITEESLIYLGNIDGIKEAKDTIIANMHSLLVKFRFYFIISLALLCILLIIKIKEKSSKVCDKCVNYR